MIGSLRGTLFERDSTGSVVIDVGGVGYEVNVTGPTSASLGEIGSDVLLRIYTRVREDAITLYGFATGEEKRCFDVLVGTHGVGPSMALALLGMYSPLALRQIVAMEDAEALSQVPGVGKKTAARLLVELKAKLDIDFDTEMVDIGSSVGTTTKGSVRSDVAAALTGLGYSGDEIRRVVANLPSEGKVEDLLRLALRELVVS